MRCCTYFLPDRKIAIPSEVEIKDDCRPLRRLQTAWIAVRPCRAAGTPL